MNINEIYVNAFHTLARLGHVLTFLSIESIDSTLGFFIFPLYSMINMDKKQPVPVGAKVWLI